jgi:hypothetical protein
VQHPAHLGCAGHLELECELARKRRYLPERRVQAGTPQHGHRGLGREGKVHTCTLPAQSPPQRRDLLPCGRVHPGHHMHTQTEPARTRHFLQQHRRRPGIGLEHHALQPGVPQRLRVVRRKRIGARRQSHGQPDPGAVLDQHPEVAPPERQPHQKERDPAETADLVQQPQCLERGEVGPPAWTRHRLEPGLPAHQGGRGPVFDDAVVALCLGFRG